MLRVRDCAGFWTGVAAGDVSVCALIAVVVPAVEVVSVTGAIVSLATVLVTGT
jgi:hypothetical protein